MIIFARGSITMEDISNKNDITVFVDSFYEKVRHDTLIGPVFFGAITGDWQPHLDRMYAFWDSVLFSTPGFTGNPFAKHVPLRISQEHFDRWLVLFDQTIEENFIGPVADDAKLRARSIAKIFVSRLDGMKH
jgi:hemoglobin